MKTPTLVSVCIQLFLDQDKPAAATQKKPSQPVSSRAVLMTAERDEEETPCPLASSSAGEGPAAAPGHAPAAASRPRPPEASLSPQARRAGPILNELTTTLQLVPPRNTQQHICAATEKEPGAAKKAALVLLAALASCNRRPRHFCRV